METNSFSTNKIVSILIAVIVAACVLIPICNEFGNNGGDSPSPLADNVWVNPGTPMREIDMSDHSKTYTFSIDGGYENGTILAIGYNTGEDTETPDLVGVYYYNHAFYLYEPGAEPSYSLEVKWDDDCWKIMRGNHGNIFPDNPKIFIYDENSENNGIMYWATPDYDGIHPTLSEIKFAKEPNCEIIVNLDYGIDWAEYHIINGETIGKYAYDDVIEYPQIQINDLGELEIIGDMTINLDGETTIIPNSELSIYRVGGLIPRTIEIQSDGGNSGNSGITGTLITLIPVFVVLGILGSVAYMMFGRNEITQ